MSLTRHRERRQRETARRARTFIERAAGIPYDDLTGFFNLRIVPDALTIHELGPELQQARGEATLMQSYGLVVRRRGESHEGEWFLVFNLSEGSQILGQAFKEVDP